MTLVPIVVRGNYKKEVSTVFNAFLKEAFNTRKSELIDDVNPNGLYFFTS